MQNGWLFFSNLGFQSRYPFFLAAEPCPSSSYGSERWLELGLFLDQALNHYARIHVPGSFALGQSLVAVVQATGGFLFWLMKGRASDLATSHRISNHLQDLRHRNYHHSSKRLEKTGMDFDIGRGSVSELQGSSTPNADTPIILARVASITVANLWSGCEKSSSFPVGALVTAFVPPLDKLSSKLLPVPVEGTIEETQKESQMCLKNHCEVKCPGEWDMVYLPERKNGSIQEVVEPRTGVKFPTALISADRRSNDASPISQVLIGIGARSTTIIKLKSVKIYAFGIYVRPDCVCKKLGQKYSTVPPEELKNQPEFFKDILRQDMHITLRLVVHYKGLKLSMVRNAFESALRNRLRKIKGVPDDDGLIAFCSYFSRDISLTPGTTIDFHQMPGGKLRTEVGGKELGTIYSGDLCRAFLDMYIGETPVSLTAKHDIGENIGRVIKKCS